MADLRSPGVLDWPRDLVSLALAGDEAAFARITARAGRRLSEGDGRQVAGRSATGALAAPEAGR